MATKTLLLVAGGVGVYLLLSRKHFAFAPPQQLDYIPPAPKNETPREYAHAAQQFNNAAQLEALETIGVPVKPMSPTAKQQAAAVGGALGAVGGAAICTAYGAAAAAPMCGAVGGFAGKTIAPAVYGAGKKTGKVALSAVKAATANTKAIIKSPVKGTISAVKSPVKLAGRAGSAIKKFF